MKRLIFFAIIISSILYPAFTFAETSVDISNNGSNAHSSVDVQTNTGNNTICQNGKCETTSSGNGESKVCINGNCQTSKDGNLNIHTEDGNTKVNIQNSTNNNPSTYSYPKPGSENKTNSQVNINSNKTDNIKNKIEEKKKHLKQKIEQERNRLPQQSNAFQQLLDNINNFLKSFHF